MEEKINSREDAPKPKPFVHLHVHTEYSLLDGAAKISGLFKKCSELNMPAIAITDHGNMFGACKFDAAAMSHTLGKYVEADDWIKLGLEYKVKPIFGCEFYVCPDMSIKFSEGGRIPKLNHLVLLAKDYEGYLNLAKLNAESYINGYYYKPRIDHKLLEKHTKGLVGLSACLAGVIPQALLNGEYERAKEAALYYKSIFNEGDFYIELQDHNLPEQRSILPLLVRLAKETGIKPVATNDVHYIGKDDHEMQKVLQCINYKKKLNDSEDGNDDYFPTQEFYLKNYDEMYDRFGYIKEALDNTLEIADKCNVLLKYKQHLLPNYFPPDKSTPYQYLRKLTFDGLNKKYPVVTQEIIERAEYELGVIAKQGFVEYFLIVWDFIDYAERVNIPVGPGRGSGVGSIVAYATGITKVEPLKYNLLFERFLNEERVSMPDFDIDFCVDRRDEVIDYVIEKYGAEKVSQIVTFGTLAIKAAIKDVGRVMDVPYSETDRMSKAVGNPDKKAHLMDIIGKGNPDFVVKELQEMYNNNDTARRVLDMAARVEGRPRQIGMHAAGVVICKDAISDHIPQARSGEDITTQFDMVEVEKLGLLKMDFLGLRTLTDIFKAIEAVNKNRNIKLDMYALDYDDPNVFSLISSGDTHAIFQLESEGMKNFMSRLRPESLEDIIAGISLYRPGPMDSIDTYVDCKNNPLKIAYDHPLLEPILKVTYGCLVYQEQVMDIVRVLGGYTLGGADILRRLMSKKKQEEMKKQKDIFIYGGVVNGKQVSGAVANGVDAAIADKIFEKIEKFASYAFNKSHAAAYAYVAYQTAFLKRYYPVEFLTAVLNNRISNSDDIRNYLSYAAEKNIKVLPPCVNNSEEYFTAEGENIRIGLAAIKNVGLGIMQQLKDERNKNGKFKSFPDFIKRVDALGCNKRMFENLINAGALDCFGYKRSQLIQNYESVIEKFSKQRQAEALGQFSFFSAFEEADEINIPDAAEFDLSVKLAFEKEAIGVYVSGHPLDPYKPQLSGLTFDSRKLIGKIREDGEESELVYENVSDRQRVVIGGMLISAERIITKKSNTEMGVGKLEDLYGTVEVMVSGKSYPALKDKFVSDAIVKISGSISLREGETPKLWIDNIEPLLPVKASGSFETPKKEILYLLFDVNDKMIESEVFETLRAYPGETEVRAVNSVDKKQTYILEYKAALSKALVYELTAVIGKDNIKIVEKSGG